MASLQVHMITSWSMSTVTKSAEQPQLSYDIIVHILEELYTDLEYNLLSQCAIVNSEFNRVASRLLYSQVVYSPPFRPILDLKDKGIPPEPSAFTSAILSRNSPHVIALEISGHLPTRPPPQNALAPIIANAVRQFTNLRSIKLVPIAYHPVIFTETLKGLTRMESIAVNASCLDEANSLVLATMIGLNSLTIHDPSRAVLWLLPEWLGRLSDSLTQLHLLDNCGSVTPGVLRSLAPPIRERVRSLALGISYSLTDDDIFHFLSQIPEIQHLELRYYFQLKTPLTKPRLIHLRSFTVRHHRMFNRYEVRFLCKWIRRIISNSPVETLRLMPNDPEEIATGAHVSFSSLIGHLVEKQAATLRCLDLGGAFVGVNSLRRLLGACVWLEELHIASGEKALRIFAEYAPGLTRLHTASFDICNVSRKKARAVAADGQLADAVIRAGLPSLRRLVVNGICWEGSWNASADTHGTAEFCVRKRSVRKAPWDEVT